MRVAASLLLAAASVATCSGAETSGAARTALNAMGVADVIELLREWNLDHVFGAEFEEMRINGALLNMFAPGDLNENNFPRADKLHWKLLDAKLTEHRKLTAAPTGSRRRSLVTADDDDGFSGINIVANRSKISFGEVGDVQLRRSGAGMLEVLGDFLLGEADSDADAVNVGSTLMQLAADISDLKDSLTGVAPPGLCLSSCMDFLERYPKTKSGVQCIALDSSTTQDMYCDMDVHGGGWTYVARGSDSNDGCQQDSYGTVSTNMTINSRWSLGQDTINNLAMGYDYLEYLVTTGENNDNGYDPLDQWRLFRISTQHVLNFAEPMDATYNTQVWQGNHWITVEYECNTADCGPCWEPGRQNFCCDDTMSDCELALMDQEGQWSNSNTNQHLRCDVSDYDQDQLVLLVRGSNNRGKECYSSCYQAKQHQPDAASGVYCITVGGDETNRLDLYCDMETMGGGWTYVARGSNSDDGCDTDAFGTVSADHFLNSRWSLGNWAINEIGYDQGTKWLEYYVTVGHNSDNGYAPHDKFRLARVPLGSNFTLGSGMDVDYDVEVWNGGGWTAMEKGCASTDCGPCWEPSYQNWCCENDQSGLLLDCAQAGMNQEGQWSNANTNQHLRCDDSDSDQDQLVLFVR